MSPRVEHLAEGKVALHCGDCLELLKTLEPNSVDSCVTDPPYGLSFMGKAWDHGVPGVEYWKQVFRVLKPGAHLLSFGGTRTFGRMHVAIEDAGFEIRDMISWLYGSGFPKSLDISKAIDKAVGAEREVVGPGTRHNSKRCAVAHGDTERLAGGVPDITAPATDAARQWAGFGTALKPACEPIVLARKPLSESTVAANVLKWGTGALNIDGCRVATDEELNGGRYSDSKIGDGGNVYGSGINLRSKFDYKQPLGRWPANVIHDGSDEVVGAFPETSAGTVGVRDPNGTMGYHGGASGLPGVYSGHADAGGSAARFFYTAKADADDRLGSKHPTVKPLDLMQYLVRLVTPPKGLVLDPFAGTGTTGEACIREGMSAILIEREEEYQNDIRRRMRLAMSGADERKRESMKASGKVKTDFEPGTLFA